MLSGIRTLAASTAVLGASLFAGQSAFAQTTGTIDFEGIAAGTIISSVDSVEGVGPVGIYGDNTDRFGMMNVATIFDSSNPTGGDVDLGTPNEDFMGPGIGNGGKLGAIGENSVARGNVLIVAENIIDADMNGLIDTPDDEGVFQVEIIVDFRTISAPFTPDNVTVTSLTLLDVEEGAGESASIDFFAADDTLLGSIIVPDEGDNGVVTLDTSMFAGVGYFRLNLAASGAITDIEFEIDGDDEEEPGLEGCTPGYWKNHPLAWVGTGLATGDPIESLFAEAANYNVAGSSLLDNLSNNGGGGAEGAARILLRAAVAGALNASNGNVDYPVASADLIAAVNGALASGHRGTMIALASDIDSDNNLGCPIGLDGAPEND